MSILLKIILGIIATVLLGGLVVTLAGAGLAGYAITKAAKSTPAEIEKAAESIASFTVPEGYQPDYSLSQAGFTVAAYDPGDGRSHLTFVQGPKGLTIDGKSIDELLAQARPSQADRTTRLTVVETRTVTIRGKETTLVVQDGTSGDGRQYRQATAVFEGNSGPAAVMLEEPLARWDDARVTALIESIE